MSNTVRVAIVGSGPSGLSCAAHAAERKVPHVLLEAERALEAREQRPERLLVEGHALLPEHLAEEAKARVDEGLGARDRARDIVVAAAVGDTAAEELTVLVEQHGLGGGGA